MNKVPESGDTSTPDVFPRTEIPIPAKTHTGHAVRLLHRACDVLGGMFPFAPIQRARGARALRFDAAGTILRAVAAALARQDTPALAAWARSCAAYLQTIPPGTVCLYGGKWLPPDTVYRRPSDPVEADRALPRPWSFDSGYSLFADRATAARRARAFVVRRLSEPGVGTPESLAAVVAYSLSCESAIASALPQEGAGILARRAPHPVLVRAAKRALAEDFPDDEALAESLIRRSLVALGYPKRAASSLFEADGVKMKRAAKSAGLNHSDT